MRATAPCRRQLEFRLLDRVQGHPEGISFRTHAAEGYEFLRLKRHWNSTGPTFPQDRAMVSKTRSNR